MSLSGIIRAAPLWRESPMADTPTNGAELPPRAASVDERYWLGLLVLLCAFLPILYSGYFSDDAARRDLAELSSREFWRQGVDGALWWWYAAGRVLPLAILADSFPLHVFGGAFEYRLYCYVASVIVAVAFWKLLDVVLDRRLALLFPVAMAIVMQLRDYHDALLAFATLYQSAFLLIVLAALAGHRYGKSGGWRSLLGSGACFALALLTSEVSFALIPFLLFVVWMPERSRRTLVRAGLVFCGIALAFFLVGRLGLHMGAARGIARSANYTPNFEVGGVLVAFAKQVSSALPYSYVLLKPKVGAWSIVATPFGRPMSSGAVLGVALIAASVAGSVWGGRTLFARQSQRPLTGRLGNTVWIGLLLSVPPASVIAFSPKYQGELAWGNGYLPVYVQCFGAAVLVAFLLWQALTWAAARGMVPLGGIAVAVAVAAGLTATTNWRVVEAHNEAWTLPMRSDDVVMRAPEARRLCEGGTLYLNAGAPWLLDKFLVGRLGANEVRRGSAWNSPGSGCFFQSATTSYHRVSRVLGPVDLEDGHVILLPETKVVTAAQSVASCREQDCSVGLP
jgi:hypothetical protein